MLQYSCGDLAVIDDKTDTGWYCPTGGSVALQDLTHLAHLQVKTSCGEDYRDTLSLSSYNQLYGIPRIYCLPF